MRDPYHDKTYEWVDNTLDLWERFAGWVDNNKIKVMSNSKYKELKRFEQTNRFLRGRNHLIIMDNQNLQLKIDSMSKQLQEAEKSTHNLIKKLRLRAAIELWNNLKKQNKLPKVRMSFKEYKRISNEFDELPKLGLPVPVVAKSKNDCRWKTDLSSAEWQDLYDAGYILPDFSRELRLLE